MTADILVIPFNAERDHAGYMLKGMWAVVPEWAVETVRDSGLIILPHLTRRGGASHSERQLSLTVQRGPSSV